MRELDSGGRGVGSRRSWMQGVGGGGELDAGGEEL